ncbi:MAG: hypothetical protein WDW38_003374 [Sanguina aurantia]
MSCAVCGSTEDVSKCAACLSVQYCCREHQKEDWKAHKAACRSSSTGAGTSSAGASVRAFGPPASSWAEGLGSAERAEWLVDCYRMRVDDDYVNGGCNLHGLYDPDHTAMTVTLDFAVFCKLALANNVLPDGWDWKVLLSKAGGLLPFAFEKSDAQKKYGRENKFAALMGGRSLRATGTSVWRSDNAIAD